MLYNGLFALIGNTPIVSSSFKHTLFMKLEYFNPFGSIKDRIVSNIISSAEKTGELRPEGIIIEATSGNTGIACAAIANLRRYKFICIMPEDVTEERVKLLRLYGAMVILTPKTLGMHGCAKFAHKLLERIPNAFFLNQFNDANNIDAHFNTTAVEIIKDIPDLDILVCGIGTSGTLTGVGSYLKSVNPNIKIIGVEPTESPLLSKGFAHPHKIQGIGANFIPPLFSYDVCDEIMTVSSDEAKEAIMMLLQKESLFVGFSGGAVFHVARFLCQKEENKNKKILAIIPDSGYKYLSLL